MSEARKLVVCVRNDGYLVSLERRKLYIAISDRKAEAHALRRVIDESGDDYLYPAEYFVEVKLPQDTRRAVLTAI